jgi:hypothetical protein
MKVYLIFVFLLAAPALVRLVSSETSTTADASTEASVAHEKPAAVEAPPSTPSATALPPSPATTAKPTAVKDRPVSQLVPAAHTFYFM